MKKLIHFAILLALVLFAFTACAGAQGPKGEDGKTPTIEISEDGYWVINGEKTEYQAIGQDGKDGKDGADGKDGTNGQDGKMPTIEISADGYWVINGEKTNVLADASSKEDAEEGTPGLAYYLKDDGTYAVGAGTTTYLSEIVIPATYQGRAVTEIAECGFEVCYRLTNVVIPDSVTSIGSGAFSWCTSLTSVVIEDSVTSIGNRAFYDCNKLVEVINHSSLEILAGSSDYGGIASCAIEVHTGESKIDRVGDYLFYTYKNVHYLLGYVGNDTELTLPDSYKGESYEIYQYAFYERDDLTNVVIPDSVTSIGSSAFQYCSSLTSVVIGNDVTSIGNNAFCECSLKSVVIGNSVIHIGTQAFAWCGNLTSIKYRGTEEQWNVISKEADWDDCSGPYPIIYNYGGE